MEYEVAVTPSSSIHEMVRDVVVEEMTDTLSPSGVERGEQLQYILSYFHARLCCKPALYTLIIPSTVMLAESEDGLLLDTVQVYSPPVVTVRVCVYCAVTGSSNTVSVPSVTVMESLVQVTVVAGPPVEIQVRVIWSESNITSPDIVMSPVLIQF